MGYSIRPEHVTHNAKLLEAIEATLLEGRIFIIKPVEGKSVSQIEFQIRNVLKSAEHYPDLGFGHLSSQIKISAKVHGVELHPRYGFAAPRELNELDVVTSLLTEIKSYVIHTFRPSDHYDEAAFIDTIGEWKISNMEHNADGTITVNLTREVEESATAFSVLGTGAESESFDEYIQKLTEESNDSSDSSGSDGKPTRKPKRRQATRKSKKVK